MGPYYRSTSQGMGRLFELCYEHPVLMLIIVVGIIGAGIYLFRRKNKDEQLPL